MLFRNWKGTRRMGEIIWWHIRSYDIPVVSGHQLSPRSIFGITSDLLYYCKHELALRDKIQWYRTVLYKVCEWIVALTWFMHVGWRIGDWLRNRNNSSGRYINERAVYTTWRSIHQSWFGPKLWSLVWAISGLLTHTLRKNKNWPYTCMIIIYHVQLIMLAACIEQMGARG